MVEKANAHSWQGTNLWNELQISELKKNVFATAKWIPLGCGNMESSFPPQWRYPHCGGTLPANGASDAGGREEGAGKVASGGIEAVWIGGDNLPRDEHLVERHGRISRTRDSRLNQKELRMS
jgi:hypothetical protein